MKKDIDQDKQELLAHYEAEIADARAQCLTEQEALLSEAMQAKRRLLDTAPLIQEEGSPADISSSHRTKILRNLDKLASLLDNVSFWRKSILSDIADALGAKSKGSASRY